jgi:hypothetical protein
MFEIHPEVVLITQGFLYRPEKHFIAIHAFSAFDAHQVMVMPFFCVVVDNMVAGFAF